jgi:hypothetical protein
MFTLRLFSPLRTSAEILLSVSLGAPAGAKSSSRCSNEEVQGMGSIAGECMRNQVSSTTHWNARAMSSRLLRKFSRIPLNLT